MGDTTGVSNGGNEIYYRLDAFPQGFSSAVEIGRWARKKLKHCPGVELHVVTGQSAFSIGSTGHNRIHVSSDERPLPGWMMVRLRGPAVFTGDALALFKNRVGVEEGLSPSQYDKVAEAAAAQMVAGGMAAAAQPSKPWEKPLPEEMEGIRFDDLGISFGAILQQLLNSASMPYPAKRWFLGRSGVHALATILFLREDFAAETRGAHEIFILDQWPRWEERAKPAALAFKESGLGGESRSEDAYPSHLLPIIDGWPNVRNRIPSRINVTTWLGDGGWLAEILYGRGRLRAAISLDVGERMYYAVERMDEEFILDLARGRNGSRVTLSFEEIANSGTLDAIVRALARLDIRLSDPGRGYVSSKRFQLDNDPMLSGAIMRRVQEGLNNFESIRLYNSSLGRWCEITASHCTEVNFASGQGEDHWGVTISSARIPELKSHFIGAIGVGNLGGGVLASRSV